LLSREDKKRKQLAELGIEYDFAGYRGAGKEEQVEAKVEEAAKPTPKKKGRKSAGGEEVRSSALPLLSVLFVSGADCSVSTT
jgi:hypothetical protein